MKRDFTVFGLLLTGLVIGACSDQSPLGVETTPAAARSSAQAGTYEISFHTTGFYGIGEHVAGAPVGTEMGVRANVRDSEGNLARAGSVLFERCELAGAPAPSATCGSGNGRWTRYHRMRMDPSGYPPTVYGGRCTSPTVIGFRFRYSGERSGIADGTSAANDFTWY